MKNFIGIVADQNGFAKFKIFKATSRRDAREQLYEVAPPNSSLVRGFELTTPAAKKLIDDLRKALPDLE